MRPLELVSNSNGNRLGKAKPRPPTAGLGRQPGKALGSTPVTETDTPKKAQMECVHLLRLETPRRARSIRELSGRKADPAEK